MLSEASVFGCRVFKAASGVTGSLSGVLRCTFCHSFCAHRALWHNQQHLKAGKVYGIKKAVEITGTATLHQNKTALLQTGTLITIAVFFRLGPSEVYKTVQNTHAWLTAGKRGFVPAEKKITLCYNVTSRSKAGFKKQHSMLPL